MTVDRVRRAERPRSVGLAGSSERAVLAAGLVGLFLLGYFGLDLGRAIRPARELSTRLDGWLPFVPGAVWIYATAYPMAFAPLLVLRDPRLYRRTVAALAAVIAVSLVCFALFPVSTAALRPDAAALATPGFTAWTLRKLYALDPPRNAFPSLHLAIGTVIALPAGRGDRLLRLAGTAWLVALALSASLVKQHFVADTVAGLLLGVAADVWIVRRAGRSSAPRATSRRGALGLVGVAALFYAGLYAVFRLFA